MYSNVTALSERISNGKIINNVNFVHAAHVIFSANICPAPPPYRDTGEI